MVRESGGLSGSLAGCPGVRRVAGESGGLSGSLGRRRGGWSPDGETGRPACGPGRGLADPESSRQTASLAASLGG